MYVLQTIHKATNCFYQFAILLRTFLRANCCAILKTCRICMLPCRRRPNMDRPAKTKTRAPRTSGRTCPRTLGGKKFKAPNGKRGCAALALPLRKCWKLRKVAESRRYAAGWLTTHPGGSGGRYLKLLCLVLGYDLHQQRDFIFRFTVAGHVLRFVLMSQSWIVE